MSKTNFEVITESVDSLVEFIDRMKNEERDDWFPVGCYNCINYGTHHADKSLIGTEDEHLYECTGCEFENGIKNWLEQEADEILK